MNWEYEWIFIYSYTTIVLKNVKKNIAKFCILSSLKNHEIYIFV